MPNPTPDPAPQETTDTPQKKTCLYDPTIEVNRNCNPIPLERHEPHRILGFMPNFRSAIMPPYAMATSGGDLYVLQGDGTIGWYDSLGMFFLPDLVTGLATGYDNSIAVSGGDLFVTQFNVANPSQTSVAEYTTDGELVNASLITGLPGPAGIVESGGDLFLLNYWTGTIGEYTTSGAVVNASLVTGLNSPSDIAVSGGDLFVANNWGGTIGEYTTSGATVNASLISTGPEFLSDGLAVSGGNVFDSLYVTPEPSSIVLLAISGAALAACDRRKRRVPA